MGSGLRFDRLWSVGCGDSVKAAEEKNKGGDCYGPMSAKCMDVVHTGYDSIVAFNV